MQQPDRGGSLRLPPPLAPDSVPVKSVTREISIAMGEIGLRCVFILDSLDHCPDFNPADAARITQAIQQVGAAALEVQDAIRRSAERKARS